MSNSPEAEFNLELHFLPAWAQKSAETNRYADHPGDRAEGRGYRQERRRRPEGGRPGAGPRRNREGGPRPPGGGGRRPERDDRGWSQDRRGGERPKPLPLPDLDVTLVPDNLGVESLAKQIRMTGRAYPLFEIAQMVLKRPERHLIKFSVKKNAEGQPVQALFVSALDESPWLSEDEAVRHVLDKHFDTFYQTEKIQTAPPKGTYTFVAQCGMSGIILGPPNHHDYQNQLRKLHGERFSRMPFEGFKARVKIVRDEAVVKKWLEDQSYKTEYLCLNMPEPLKLDSKEAVEKHFRETHLPTIVRRVDSHEISGVTAQRLRCPALQRLVRHTYEQQRRFPLQIATVLSHQFADQGLQFFKVNKTVTHVAVARPHFLDLDAAPVSETVKRIVTFIDAHPKCSRRKLVEALAPSPAPATPQPPDAEQPQEANQPTPEQTAIIADLHWLIHQGHVIEFADGLLETAKKPFPKPVRAPKSKPAAQPVPPPATDSASAEASTPADPSAAATTPVETDAAPTTEPAGSTPENSETTPAPESSSSQGEPAEDRSDSSLPIEEEKPPQP